MNEEYTQEEIDAGWGSCLYCGDGEEECLCNSDDTERFYR